MKKGWITLHRSFFEHPLWEQDREFSRAEAWIDLIHLAKFKDEKSEVCIKDRYVSCSRGQLLHSLLTLSKRWKWSRSKVKRVLDVFASRDMIVIENETVTSRITICNYDTYQPKENGSETEVKQGRNRSETEADTLEEGKEGKKEKNKELVDLDEPNTTQSDDLVLTGSDEKKHGVCPYKQIVDLYNDILGTTELKRCKIAVDSRKAALRRTWAFFKYDTNAFRGYFKQVKESDFLCGRGKNKWKADFDWLLKQGNIIKVIEGNYENE